LPTADIRAVLYKDVNTKDRSLGGIGIVTEQGRYDVLVDSVLGVRDAMDYSQTIKDTWEVATKQQLPYSNLMKSSTHTVSAII
jgi:hypothetical protein